MSQSATQTAPETVPGLTSIRLVVNPGEEEHYQLFRDRLAVDIQPVNQLEYNLFNQLAAAQWQLMHIAAMESKVLSVVPEIYTDGECYASLDRLLRHRQRLEVTQAKVLKELRLLQTQRHNREAETVEPPPMATVRRRGAKAVKPPVPIDKRRPCPIDTPKEDAPSEVHSPDAVLPHGMPYGSLKT